MRKPNHFNSEWYQVDIPSHELHVATWHECGADEQAKNHILYALLVSLYLANVASGHCQSFDQPEQWVDCLECYETICVGQGRGGICDGCAGVEIKFGHVSQSWRIDILVW